MIDVFDGNKQSAYVPVDSQGRLCHTQPHTEGGNLTVKTLLQIRASPENVTWFSCDQLSSCDLVHLRPLCSL